jgi:hypothetical protein
MLDCVHPELLLAVEPAAGVSFALVEDRPVLFSETHQKIYELDRLGAYIWCNLVEGKTIETIFNDVVELGIDRSEARHFLSHALRDWLDLALIDVDWQNSAEFTLQAQLASHTISVRASNEKLLERVAAIFSHVGPETDQCDVIVEIIEFDDLIVFRINKNRTYCCESDGVAPAVKARLVESVILQADFTLHGASLVSDRGGLLLCGRPGAGKSTLALHLTDAGFQYGGDDLVLIAPNGKATGIPFAPAVKPGSWNVVSRFRNDLSEAAVHRRPDGIPVRYLPLARIHTGSFAISWFIFLNRIEGAPADLTPLGEIESMRRVIAGSFAANGKLSQTGFIALKQMLLQAKSFELTYSHAAEAQGLLVDLYNGRSS